MCLNNVPIQFPTTRSSAKMSTNNIIRFSKEHVTYGFLSNFYYSPFNLSGFDWPTVEHYFQAQKSFDPAFHELIISHPMPSKAKALGRSVDLREDWEEVKEDVMLEALRGKFGQNSDLKGMLLETEEADLIERAPWDRYWGDGKDGKGKNRLGVLLMKVREELRKENIE